MSCAFRREGDDLGQPAAVAGLGQDAQPFGQEKPFGAASLLVAQRAQQLDRGIGEGGYLTGHYSSPKRSSTSAINFASASSAPSPSTWMTMLSPIAAPSIISPMIDVPQTRLPSFSTSIGVPSSLARLTNFALARAWSPRLLPISTWRLTAVKRLLPRGFRKQPRYTCGPLRARRQQRRALASPCARPRGESASAGSRPRSPRYFRSSSG